MLIMLNAELPSVIAVFACLIISAFFSAAETAITSLGTLKARHMLDGLKGRTRVAMRMWIHTPGRVLTTILVFNNGVNILASSIVTKIAIEYFSNAARSFGCSTKLDRSHW